MFLQPVQHINNFVAGADPGSKFRGDDLSNYLAVKSHCGFSTVKEMTYTSQHSCDKTMDGQIALYREFCLPNY